MNVSGKHSSLLRYGNNEKKSPARFCQQVAKWVTDMFCNFYLMKSHKKC